MVFFPLNFWAKSLKLDIMFSRYDNFTDDVITDQWKGDYEKKAFKSLGICTDYWHSSNSKVHFYIKKKQNKKKKTTHEVLQATWRVDIEDSKICEVLQSPFGPYFEIFQLCIPVTHNWVFRQLVPFDILSHIFILVRKKQTYGFRDV